MAFIDENTQFYKQLYNHSKNMYTTAIVAFFATGLGSRLGLKMYIFLTLEFTLVLKNLSVDNECKWQILSLI